ncbi:S4 domain-containing protein [Parabacteroides sp. AM08-6]|uniref:S4 domain-containing protein n=1 Tax=Parabacteroides sp. AM08-6 TaxID=2292053 RepID=UPI000EFE9BBC|nr:S4 domain-containing protein [Parabacteroides sp. AM08-6]RHJ78258.1 pseudouridine synthase [Parabacteroides sp. AM08-6]
MEIRLNKLISDSGLCSRREADKFIETGRVTVNGQLPHIGQKVSENDIVMLDDIKVQVGKHTAEHVRVAAGKTQGLVFGNQKKEEKNEFKKKSSEKKVSSQKPEEKTSGDAISRKKKELRPGKYIKYNKYAAARKAAQEGEKTTKETKKGFTSPQAIKEALQPKFGKSLGRSAVAQRLAASPKSASLRKTSKNNPINKTKRTRNKYKGGEE